MLNVPLRRPISGHIPPSNRVPGPVLSIHSAVITLCSQRVTRRGAAAVALQMEVKLEALPIRIGIYSVSKDAVPPNHRLHPQPPRQPLLPLPRRPIPVTITNAVDVGIRDLSISNLMPRAVSDIAP